MGIEIKNAPTAQAQARSTRSSLRDRSGRVRAWMSTRRRPPTSRDWRTCTSPGTTHPRARANGRAATLGRRSACYLTRL